jgi:hypothetical protein
MKDALADTGTPSWAHIHNVHVYYGLRHWDPRSRHYYHTGTLQIRRQPVV